MPAALTLILICPSPGSGSGTWAHFSTSGGPYPVITTALGMAVASWWRVHDAMVKGWQVRAHHRNPVTAGASA